MAVDYRPENILPASQEATLSDTTRYVHLRTHVKEMQPGGIIKEKIIYAFLTNKELNSDAANEPGYIHVLYNLPEAKEETGQQLMDKVNKARYFKLEY